MVPKDIEAVFLRPGMFVYEETYDNVTTFLEGYHYGKGDRFPLDFTEWLRREYKVRSCQCWSLYVAYVYNVKNNEPFGALAEKEKLKYLYGIFQRFYDSDNIVNR